MGARLLWLFASRYGVYVAGLAVLSGCSFAPHHAPNVVEQDTGPDYSIGVTAPPPPLDVAVVDERFMNGVLEVGVEVTPRARLSRDIALRLVTMTDGEPVVETATTIDRSLLNEAVGRTKGVQTLISAHSPTATDYQLEVAWGDAADEFMKAVALGGAGDPARRGIRLRDVRIATRQTECAGGADCNEATLLVGELYNGGDSVVSKAVLGVGYLPLSRRPSEEASHVSPAGGIPEEEVSITLDALNLVPGTAQPLELTLESSVAELNEALVRPSLRVISIE